MACPDVAERDLLVIEQDPGWVPPPAFTDEMVPVRLVVDWEGRIRDASDDASILLSSGRDLVGRPLLDLLSPIDGELLTSSATLRTPSAYLPLFLYAPGQRTGVPACVLVSADLRVDIDDTRWTVVLKGRRPKPGDLREARVLQAARYEIVGQLASGVAHELNNVLSTVTTLSDLLLTRFSPGSTEAEDLSEIKLAAREASLVLRKLDLFAGGRAKGPSWIHVGDVLSGLEKLTRRFLGPDTSLEIDVAEGCPPVFADPLRLEEAVFALVANARDAMPEGGSLKISATVIPNEADPGTPFLRLSVEDSGPGGVEPGGTEGALESRKSADHGTGLGTFVAVRFATSVGGRYALGPGRSGGTVACLELPVEDATQTPGVDQWTIR